MTAPDVELKAIEHLDFAAPCECKTHQGQPRDAQFVVRCQLPCGCLEIALWCHACVEELNQDACWHCSLVHHNIGVALDWTRLESLR